MTSSDAARRRRGWFVAGLLASVMAAAPGAAHAQPQPTAGDLESARALFKQGKDLRATGNPADLRAALDKFTAAHTYAATPLTALELGRTQAALGQLVEARETLLSVARLKVQNDETDKSATARTEAAELAEQIKPRIAGLTVKLQGASPEGKVTLTVDGAPVIVVAGSATRKLNPGPHELVASNGVAEDRKSITLKVGESQDVVLAPRWSEPVTPAPVITPPGHDATDASTRGSRTGRTLVIVGAVVGGVAVAAGTVTGLLALGKASRVKNACLDKTHCTTTAKSDYDAGRTLGTISTVSFIVGGAGAALAVVGLLMPSDPPKKGLRIEPGLGLGWAGVNGAF